MIETHIYELMNINIPYIITKQYSKNNNDCPEFIIITGNINNNYYIYCNIYDGENNYKLELYSDENKIKKLVLEYLFNYQITYATQLSIKIHNHHETSDKIYIMIKFYTDNNFSLKGLNDNLKSKYLI